jgi:hypothetical protein
MSQVLINAVIGHVDFGRRPASRRLPAMLRADARHLRWWHSGLASDADGVM